jgi:hypothetical protein
VVGVGEVQAGRRDVVELLARAGRGLGDVDDLEDLGAAEAGDLHGTHLRRLCRRVDRPRASASRSEDGEVWSTML